MMNSTSITVVWRFLDGRPGHENQTIGLSDALLRQADCECVDVHVPRDRKGMRFLLSPSFGDCENRARRMFLIGAGHATHMPMLAARFKYGGLATVIMKPTIPMSFFDLCLVRFTTRQCRTTARCADRRCSESNASIRFQDPRKGMILIGGPSRHFGWNDESVLRQVTRICAMASSNWTIVTSERTPASFVQLCRRMLSEASIVEPSQCGRSWLPDQLSTASTVWTTCDSMSMIYETLTCGASLGLIELQPLRDGRIVRNIQRLSLLGLVTRWSDWIEGYSLPRGRRPLCEADRCASVILERLRLRQSFDPRTPAKQYRHGSSQSGMLPGLAFWSVRRQDESSVMFICTNFKAEVSHAAPSSLPGSA